MSSATNPIPTTDLAATSSTVESERREAHRKLFEALHKLCEIGDDLSEVAKYLLDQCKYFPDKEDLSRLMGGARESADGRQPLAAAEHGYSNIIIEEHRDMHGGGDRGSAGHASQDDYYDGGSASESLAERLAGSVDLNGSTECTNGFMGNGWAMVFS
ncbi:MAG: hypothetical protein M1831_006090 [Alyxoria varia]|nr:MAG: hypothetical protein M1831_006090 [Alyxoria varia]